VGVRLSVEGCGLLVEVVGGLDGLGGELVGHDGGAGEGSDRRAVWAA